MILSADEMKALDNGEPVPVQIGDKQCVVVQKELFDRLSHLVFDEGSARAVYPAVLKAIDQDDENPDQYLSYLRDP